MIKNYLTIAWRNLAKHKTISFINISGLAIGIAACLIIFMYVNHEISYDKYNSKAADIVRISSLIHAPESDMQLAASPNPMADVLKKDYPEVLSAVRFEQAPANIRVENDVLREENFYKSEQSVFTMFDLKFIAGDSTNAITRPDCIVLTESVAKKYFGKVNPVGKTLNIRSKEILVTGVIEDLPTNSDLRFSALLSTNFSTEGEWASPDIFTYVLLAPGTSLKTFKTHLDEVSKQYVRPAFDQMEAKDYSMEFIPEKLTGLHFIMGKHGDTPKGNSQSIYIFSGLALFILVIALLNYINLSTAKSVERAREVGIRKVVGAGRLQLMRQFLFESLMIVSISLALAIAIVALALPWLESLLNTELNVNWKLTSIFTVLVFITAFMFAGFYPAFVMTNFKPIRVLKGKLTQSLTGIWLRKTVTVSQFAIAAVLIFGTTVIYRQMVFIEKRDLGFDKEHLLTVKLPRDTALRSNVVAFRAALLQRPEVRSVTVGSGLSDDGLTIGTTIVEAAGKKHELMSNYYSVDQQFIEAFGLKLIEGRNLSDSITTDKEGAYIVNRAFVNALGWKSGLNKEVVGWGGKGRIIGVVENFYHKSLHNSVEPTLLVYNKKDGPALTVSVKINPSDLPLVNRLFRENFQSLAFNYAFFDDIINKHYEKDRLTMTLFTNFTMLAIFISALGLYGLVSLITTQRKKEIGIRKVLGATLGQLFRLVTKDFAILLIVALIIALPVAGLLMSKWLGNYAYHTSLSWWMFFVPALGLLIVSLAVVSREVIRVGLVNPIRSLRTE